ncbi:MAG TPA: hypothetical protein VNO26_01645 [Candidatus Limnocylindria bacterium]|nr:hypothetical protein [Candidatus Limnocylindria bacterium]
MRTLAVAALSLALTVRAFAAEPVYSTTPPLTTDELAPANQGLEAGSSISASYLNLVYTPVKVVVAVIGGVTGGVAGLLTGGDQRAAYALWVPLMGGDYFVRPENLNGERPLAFFGSDYTDRPSTWNSTNDATYAYDALYN